MMGGPLGVFGQFLKGYTESRQAKHQQKLQEQNQMSDTAMQWAKIADSTSNDSIREMATRNMQDLILQHEKSQGEKRGLGAVLKLFKGDKKDASSMLNQIAPMLSSAPQYDTSGMSQEQIGQLGKEPQPKQEASPTEVSKTTADTFNPELEAKGIQAPASFSDISTQPPRQVQPTPSGIAQGQQDQLGTKTTPGALQRAKSIAETIAPGKSVFFPQYGGGTRYSPTNEDIENQKLKAKQKEIEIESDAQFTNAKRIAEWQKTTRDTELQQRKERLHQNPAYINSPQAIRDEMDFQIETGTPMPQPTADQLKISSAPMFEGEKVYGINGLGQKMDMTGDFIKEHPIASRLFYGVMKAGERTWEDALKKENIYAESKMRVDEELKRAQAFEANARGSYYQALPDIEKEKFDKTNKVLEKQTMINAFNRLKELDDKLWPQELERLNPMGRLGGEAAYNEAVTGVDKEGKPSKTFKPVINPDYNRPFLSFSEYKDWWYSKQLGGAKPDDVRTFAITGVNPFSGLGNPNTNPTPTVPIGNAKKDILNSLNSNSKLDLDKLLNNPD
jgi:hypothetical protein